LAVVLASATVLLAGAGAPAAYAHGGPGNQSDHRDRAHHRKLTANLTGANERPGPGDADGHGKAKIQLKKEKVCFRLSWRKIDSPTAAHIHLGARDQAGPVVTTLFSVASGLGTSITSVAGCTAADPALIAKIRKDPDAYYVNIHNAAFPAGAIRGQLH